MTRAAACLLTLVALGAHAEDAWKLDREGGGVKVFTQNAPGYSLKAYRAQMRIKAPLDSAVALIADTEAFPKWYFNCAESTVVKKVSGKEIITYFVNDSPFPVMDRDSIIHTVISQDPKTKAVRFDMNGKPDFIPVKDDYVRVPKMAGHWLFTPVNDQEIDVLLEMRSDAGGSVPSFLANQQVTVGPHKTLLAMQKILQKPRYRDAKVDYETATVTYGK